MKTKKKMILIKWVDSNVVHSSAGWVDEDFVAGTEPQVIETVGFLMKETKSHVTVCMSAGFGCVLGGLTIPKECIKKRKSISA